MPPTERLEFEAVLKGAAQFIGGLTKMQREITRVGTAMTESQSRILQSANSAAAAWGRATSAVAKWATATTIANSRVSTSQANLASSIVRSNAAIISSQNNMVASQAKSAATIVGWDDKVKIARANTRTAKIKADRDIQVSEQKTAAATAKAVNQMRSAQHNQVIAQERTRQAQIKADAQITSSVHRTADAKTRAAAIMIAADRRLAASNATAAAQIKASENNLAASSKIASKGVSALGDAGKAAGKSMFAFGSVIKGVVVALAGMAVIRGVINLLKGLIVETVTAVGEFQQLEIQFESLIARDIARATGQSIADSYAAAAAGARELAEWIKRIAVTTPFTVKTLSSTIAFATAMGLGVEASKRLTLATGNFVAAMGLTEDHMERIIYNFGQMVQQGKLTGREFRDLAVNFVPIDDILRRMAAKAGMAKEEFKKLALEGGIPVNEFLIEFMEMAETEFPNAMDRMAKTWSGVMNNIKDFIQVVMGVELLGPVIDNITARMANMLQKLLESKRLHAVVSGIGFAFSEAFDLIGRGVDDFMSAWRGLMDALGMGDFNFKKVIGTIIALGFTIMKVARAMGDGIRAITRVVNTIKESLFGKKDSAKEFEDAGQTVVISLVKGIKSGVQQASNAVGDIKNSIVGGFKNTANETYIWGYNIIKQLAIGIVTAAGQLISWAMTFVANIFTGWLAPGSPPALLPHLWEWGANVMAEFLHGFTMADFDVLDSLQGAIKGALEGLVALGDLDQEAVGELFVGISEDLIEAMDTFNQTGQIGEEIFDRLRDVGGEFGDELAILLERQIALADAIEKSEEAQRAYNNAINQTKTARSVVRNLIKDYNKLLRAGADQATLRQRLAEINAQEEQVRLAQEQENQAQIYAKAMEEAVEPLREMVKLQERLIDQLTEMARALAGTGDGGGGGETPPGEEPVEPGLPELPGGPGLGTGIKKSIDDLIKKIKEDVMRELQGLWDQLGAIWAASVGTALQNLLDKFAPFWDSFTSLWGQVLANLQKFWEEHGPGISDAIIGTINAVVANLGILIGKILEWVSNMALIFSQWLLDNGPLVESFVKTVGEIIVKLSELAIKIWDNIAPALTQLGILFLAVVKSIMLIVTSPWFQRIIDEVIRVTDSITRNIGIIATMTFQWLQTQLEAFDKWLAMHGPNIATIFEKIGKAITDLGDWISENWWFVLDNLSGGLILLEGALGIVIDVLAGDLEGAVNNAGVTFQRFSDANDTFHQHIYDNWGIALPGVMDDMAADFAITSGELDAVNLHIEGSFSETEKAIAESLGMTVEEYHESWETMIENGGSQADALNAMLAEKLQNQTGSWEDYSTQVIGPNGLVPRYWSDVNSSYDTGLSTASSSVDSALGEQLGYWNRYLGPSASINKAVEGGVQAITSTYNTELTNAELALQGQLAIQEGDFAKFYEIITGTGGQTETAMSDMQTQVNTGMTDVATEFDTGTTAVGTELTTAQTEWNQVVEDTMGMLTGSVNNGFLSEEGIIKAFEDNVDEIKAMFNSENFVAAGESMMDGLITGVNNKLGALLEAVRSAIAQIEAEIAAIDIPDGGGGDGGGGTTDPCDGPNPPDWCPQSAISGIISFFDNVTTEMSQGFETFASTILGRFQKSVQPLFDRWKDINQDIARLEKKLAKGNLTPQEMSALHALYKDRAAMADEVAQTEKRILDMQKAQADLQFVQQQMDFIEFIKEQGLDPHALLGSLELGVNADLSSLLEVMTVAMNMLVQKTEEELGMGSPSKVMMNIGRNLMRSMAGGIAKYAGMPALSAAYASAGTVSAAQTVAAPSTVVNRSVSFGDTHISSNIDGVAFVNKVRRVVRDMRY